MKRIWSYVKQVEKHLPRGRRVEVAGEIYATLKRKAEAEQAAGESAARQRPPV